MKKLLITMLICGFAIVGICSGSNLHEHGYLKNKTDTLPAGTDPLKMQMNDYVTIQAGKVILVKDNKSKPVNDDITLQDGSVVRMDGTLITKEGKTFVLHEGDKVFMSGIVEAPKMH